MRLDEYAECIDDKWKDSFYKTWQSVKSHLPDGFISDFQHGMPGFSVPLSTYPQGYHVGGTPLPFIGIAVQKKHLAVYHMGMYRDDALYEWFTEEYPKYMETKLNMGKSCIRFTNPKKIPYELLGELAGKMTVQEWIELYESSRLYE
ncbi:DUF1801 domain-containing protein [Salinicoccus kekensis]|uniref:Uncharacterized protein DUF1801 n=1 Tax=Salinicoccus kekensis TaxID=714307 RepID=A0A285US90_9STAP|nr:DUF1801 domain-containing protein [Salinicoccus kekensis]SOC44567.1 uncharacterized protein DUF1801 [Salinicoccus kekensis]